MNYLYIFGGLVAIVLGGWVTITQVKWYQKGIKDFSGGRIGLLIYGVGLIIGGIVAICQFVS